MPDVSEFLVGGMGLDRVPRVGQLLRGPQHPAERNRSREIVDPRREKHSEAVPGIVEHAQRDQGSDRRARRAAARPFADPRVADLGEHPHFYGMPPGHPPMRSFLGVPILVDGVADGSLYLTEKAGGRSFSDGDEDSAVALAGFAGLRSRAIDSKPAAGPYESARGTVGPSGLGRLCCSRQSERSRSSAATLR